MDKSGINQSDWEKVLDSLGQDSPDLKLLNDQEQVLLKELHFIKFTAKDFIEEPVDSEAELAVLMSRLNFDRSAGHTKTMRIWPRVVAAVVAIVILGAGLFYYHTKTSAENQQLVAASSGDIAPGKTGATLTLANGKKISLTEAQNGELAKEAGVVITKSAGGQLIYEIKDSSGDFNKYNTLTTAKGETYNVRLPDGSLVWMNAASSLTYSASLLESGTRKIKLDGEAYFQVVKDKLHPFIVESKGQRIEVLGTHFNVNAYGDEPVMKTTLLEGSVKVSDKHIEKILLPGFEAVNNGNDIKVDKADTELAIAWKNNNFVFANERIETVMKMVERWYDVKIVYEGPMPEDRFRGAVSRFDNISKVLNILESTGLVHFKIKNRSVYVSR